MRLGLTFQTANQQCLKTFPHPHRGADDFDYLQLPASHHCTIAGSWTHYDQLPDYEGGSELLVKLQN